ncbi:hypothetical protein G6L07_08370 [Agrobacterium rhizogenes]|nr:hypothetical protein [Rhizobium rhizogenes]
MAQDTAWMAATGPFEFHLTTTGELTLEWSTPNAEARFGIIVPADEAEKLLNNLKDAIEYQRLLAAKPPSTGPN